MIYRWQDAWQPMPTGVDTQLSSATTTIDEPGFYAAFLDLTRSVVIGVQSRPSTFPETNSLGLNYPNPFNPETTIPYTVTNNAQVSITIYDIMGRKVATLVNQKRMPGTYTTRWNGVAENGDKVASGVYIVRMSINNRIYSRKILLLK
jgi:hypothetical protein